MGKRTVFFSVVLAALVPWTPTFAGDGYSIVGRSGIMHFASISPEQKGNEDVYRFAVAEACRGKDICQVQFWVGKAPTAFPLTDQQVESKLVHWQQNLNTGLRRWMVKCSATKLFSSERECM